MIELKSSENTFWYGSHVLAGQSPKGWYFFFAEGPNNYTDQMLSVEKWKLPGLHGFSWVPAGKRFWAAPSIELRPNDQAVASLQSKSPVWKLISSFSATLTLWSKIFYQEVKPWTECGDNLMRKELLCLVLVHLGLNIVTGEWIEVRNALSCPKNNIFVQTSLDSQNWQNAWGKYYCPQSFSGGGLYSK